MPDHAESERLATEAHQALRAGNVEQARALFALAAKFEVNAFFSTQSERPRTAGIFAVSAVALWYKAGDLDKAEQLAHEALRLSYLPSFARQELRELLQAVWNELAQRDAGISFSPGQVLVSVKGGEVVTGGAPLDLILGKVQIVQNLFYRTAEYLSSLPLRVKGPASKAIQDRYRPWLFQSVPGSYQFSVAVQKPAQHEMFPSGEIGPEVLTETFLAILRACNDDPSALPEVVSEPSYRETFLKMTRNLAPTGKSFSQMEVRGAGDRGPVVLTPSSRKSISETLRPATTANPQQEAEEQILKGNLRAVDLDKDWLEISIDGVTRHVTELSEAVDDLIGPMVNHDVIVRVKPGRGQQLRFIDIEQEE